MYAYHCDKEDLLKRLKKIEGQIRGIQKMIEEDRYCVDILAQLAAVKAATNKVGLSLIDSHTKGCVSNAIKEGDGSKHIEELMEVIRVFTK
ncbi:metal-sensitive transcriptional regulator [Effusibacillus lacus]|uniref:Transcriptional regulator n=1 Tax=Effusibacillus lacus TaxID=1348429 RepID=A0A292YCI5_9BACL|nr:metal-sensitive transcriptional regulator [Effusibacillus lacus]TCS69425.1 DNA-binding FrmR family transcriptional regulator [Effusibacillus lacus]GAX89192.1 transcriptional regulator [Effusibacillus lacus]